MAAGWDALRKQGQQSINKWKQYSDGNIEYISEDKKLENLWHSYTKEIITLRRKKQEDPYYFDRFEDIGSEADICQKLREQAREKGDFFLRFNKEEFKDFNNNPFLWDRKFCLNLEHPAIKSRVEEYMDFHHTSAPLSDTLRLEFEHKCMIEFIRLDIEYNDFKSLEIGKKRSNNREIKDL